MRIAEFINLRKPFKKFNGVRPVNSFDANSNRGNQRAHAESAVFLCAGNRQTRAKHRRTKAKSLQSAGFSAFLRARKNQCPTWMSNNINRNSILAAQHQHRIARLKKRNARSLTYFNEVASK